MIRWRSYFRIHENSLDHCNHWNDHGKKLVNLESVFVTSNLYHWFRDWMESIHTHIHIHSIGKSQITLMFFFPTMGCRLNTKFLMNTCTPSSLPRYHTAWRRPKSIARPAEKNTVVETEQKQSKNGETQFHRVCLMTACRRCIFFFSKWQVDFSEKSRRPRSFHFQFWEV